MRILSFVLIFLIFLLPCCNPSNIKKSQYAELDKAINKLIENKEYERAKRAWENFLKKNPDSLYKEKILQKIKILQARIQNIVEGNNATELSTENNTEDNNTIEYNAVENNSIEDGGSIEGSSTTENNSARTKEVDPIIKDSLLPKNPDQKVKNAFKTRSKKHALLVSINDYKCKPLKGPNKEMNRLQNLLSKKFYFPLTNICWLSDKDAKKDNILQGFISLAKNVQKGDVVVFAFSGHGSSMDDNNNDEVDGKDEALCVHDREKSGDLRDDVIFYYLNQILSTGANLVVILDCCHSATGYRQGLDGSTNVRYIAPVDNQPVEPINIFDKGKIIGSLANNERLICLSACSDGEFAREKDFYINGEWETIGVFGKYLCDALEKVPEKSCWADIKYYVKNNVQQYQTAHFTGDLRRQIFGTKFISRKPYSQVVKKLGDQRISLDQGFFGGLDEGAIVAIYKNADEENPTYKNIIQNYKLMAYYKIDKSLPTNSEATLLEKKIFVDPNRDIKEGCYGILITPGKSFVKHQISIDDNIFNKISKTAKTKLKNFLKEQKSFFTNEKTTNPYPIKMEYDNTKNKIVVTGGPEDRHFLSDDSGIDKVIQWLDACLLWLRFRIIENKEAEIRKIYNKYNETIIIQHGEEEKYVDILEIKIERGKRNQQEKFEKYDSLDSQYEDVGYRVKTQDQIRLSYKNLSKKELYITAVFLGNDTGIFTWNKSKLEWKLSSKESREIDELVRVSLPFKLNKGIDYVKFFITEGECFDSESYERKGVRSTAITKLLMDLQIQPQNTRTRLATEEEVGKIVDWYTLEIPLYIEEK